ncbi:Basic 7S globulin [Acorus gramineus]|uniref:Basic 7S globulin n=1 Tax=Acorus gramineus TaxID=55184 RepID=A0AAV9BPX5_ACOGR|nr:Basic 7S globulin [Acorus gramineus]
MASPLLHAILLTSLFLSSPSNAQSSTPRPRALILPVSKDAPTSQYVVRIGQRTPQIQVEAAVDLGGRFLWVNCDAGYSSTTFRPARCRSAQCSLAASTSCGDCFSSPRPGCNNNTCGLFPYNPLIRTSTSGDLGDDVLALRSTDGSNPGPLATVPHFLFSCAPTFLLQGLASGAKGMAGLGRTRIGLPKQLSAAFSFRQKFAGEPSYEYFIGVKSIRVNENPVAVNATLLKINEGGVGGTKISTVDMYTVLESSIYKAVTDAFSRETANISRATPVAPFGLCYNAKSIGSTRVGPAVPAIDLVLQSESVYWRIFGANSMVQVNDDVLCLGFVDGGVNARTSIVIGGHQLEDNLVQFDLATSRVGFSSSLLFRQTTCANFNFTSSA